MSLVSPSTQGFAAVAATAQTISLKRHCRTLQIWTDTGAGDIYVTFDGTVPTVGGASTIKIEGGGSWESPANGNLGVNSFKYIGSAATGNLSYFGV